MAETLQGRKSGAERDSADHAAEQARSARNVNRRDPPPGEPPHTDAGYGSRERGGKQPLPGVRAARLGRDPLPEPVTTTARCSCSCCSAAATWTWRAAQHSHDTGAARAARPVSPGSGDRCVRGGYAFTAVATDVLSGWPLLREHARSAQSKNTSMPQIGVPAGDLIQRLRRFEGGHDGESRLLVRLGLPVQVLGEAKVQSMGLLSGDHLASFTSSSSVCLPV